MKEPRRLKANPSKVSGVTGERHSSVQGAVAARGSHRGAEASLVSGRPLLPWAPEVRAGGRGRGCRSVQPGGPTGSLTRHHISFPPL